MNSQKIVADPNLLCLTLISDLKTLCNNYDLMYPRDQSKHLRYFFVSLRKSIGKFEKDLQEENDTRDKETYQALYNGIVSEFKKNVYEFIGKKETHFLKQFQRLFDKYDIEISKKDLQDNRLTDEEKNVLHAYEIKAYHQALSSLQQTIKELPDALQTVKNTGNNLIDIFESQRIKLNKKTFWRPAFDYKRYTINLNKTRELFESPLDQSIQKEYEALATNNKDPNIFLAAMSAVLGAVYTAVLSVVASIFPLAFIGVGLGALYTAYSVTHLINALTEKTPKLMDEIQQIYTIQHPSLQRPYVG